MENKNIITGVETVTSVPQASKIYTNVNGALKQASIDNILANSALNVNFNNLQISNRNLWLGTKDFTGIWVNKNLCTVDNETYLGFTVMKRYGNWQGLWQIVPVVQGAPYTFSGYCKKNSGNLYILKSYKVNGSMIEGSNTLLNTSSSWGHFEYTFIAEYTGDLWIRVENNSATATTWVCGFNFASGNKILPWTPAPEDYYQDIGNGMNKFISNPTYSVEGITVVGTGDGTKEIATYTNIYCDLVAGNKYTFVFDTDGTLGTETGTDTVQVFLLKDNGVTTYYYFEKLSTTFTCGVSGRYYLKVDINKDNTTHWFKSLKIENGTKATPFSLSPEDLKNQLNGIPFTITAASNITLSGIDARYFGKQTHIHCVVKSTVTHVKNQSFLAGTIPIKPSSPDIVGIATVMTTPNTFFTATALIHAESATGSLYLLPMTDIATTDIIYL